jgi:hypothetical protein|nr:MAG: hypothetical protein [Bacteriophage sp.]UVY41616.1 MAG: hypothetical protein [Bacteriophage sp.]
MGGFVKMTIKNIMIAVAGVAAIGGVCFLAALVRETGRWLEDVCGFMDELSETGGDWR